MSVDVTHIVRHNFKEYDDLQACKKFVINTAYRLKAKLHDDVRVRRTDVAWDKIEELGWEKTLLLGTTKDYPVEFAIKLNRYDIELVLRHGFWQIVSYYHFHSIVTAVDGTLWLREVIFDIVRALGEHEVWHADEYHVDNVEEGKLPYIEDLTFNEWINFVQKSGVAELDEQYWVAHQDDWGNMPRVFHDDLSGLEERLSDIQSRWPDFEVCGLYRRKYGYVGWKDGQLCWLDDKKHSTRYIEKKEFKNIGFSSDVENYVTED